MMCKTVFSIHVHYCDIGFNIEISDHEFYKILNYIKRFYELHIHEEEEDIDLLYKHYYMVKDNKEIYIGTISDTPV